MIDAEGIHWAASERPFAWRIQNAGANAVVSGTVGWLPT